MAAESVVVAAVVPPGCKLPAAGFLGRLHVLVVDDAAVHLEELKLTLLLSGYAVTGKTTAGEALQELERNPEDYFDIIMTDVHMHGTDGFDLLHVFSEEEEVVTMVRAVMDGAVDYMVKPMTSEAIRSIWTHVLRRRLSSLAPQASSLSSERLAAAAAPLAGSRRGDSHQKEAMASPPPPAENGRRDVHEAVQAAFAPQPPVSAPDCDVQEAEQLVQSGVRDAALPQPLAPASGEVQDASAAAATTTTTAGSSRGADGQEEAAMAAATKRGAPEVSDKGSNSLEQTAGKKARVRFVWTTESHSAFVRAFYQLKEYEGIISLRFSASDIYGLPYAGPKRIQELMELEGIFVTKAQVSSHLQKFKGWLENKNNNLPEASRSMHSLLMSNYTGRQDRNISSWKRSSVTTEGPFAGMFYGLPVHPMATSNSRLTTTQTNFVGVAPKEMDNFISQGIAIGYGSAVRQASLCSEANPAGQNVHANGSSQGRGSALGNDISASYGVAVTNVDLLQVITASLPSTMRQPVQPSQSFSTINGLAANLGVVISDQNPGTCSAANSSAINNQSPATQEMSRPHTSELGHGSNVMLDWAELAGLDDQLDNDVLMMNSLFDGEHLQQGVDTAMDGTQ
uniref:Response regulatory domain-containing protein n=1 Tax=Oryza brachyantha TaxID=4533 RepID=J3M6W7_ORYBR